VLGAAAISLALVLPAAASTSLIGSSGTGPGQFKVPVAVAADRSGHVLVLDSQLSRIQRFADDGTYQLMADSQPSGAPPEQSSGLATDPAGNVFVANNASDGTGVHIDMFDDQLGYVRTVSLGSACGLAAASDVVYLLERGGPTGWRLEKWSTGTASALLAGRDVPQSELGNVECNLAVTPGGDLLIADSTQSTLAAFSGQTLTRTGSVGTFGRFGPTGAGAGVAPNGDLYAIDHTSGVSVVRLDAAGQEIARVNGQGIDTMLQNPNALAVLASGVTFIADTYGLVARIDPTPAAALTLTPPTGLLGPFPPTKTTQVRTLDASRSRADLSRITDYAFDLDGDGTYETDAGTSPTVSTHVDTAGTHHFGVQVTTVDGRTATGGLDAPVVPSTAAFTVSGSGFTKDALTFDATPSTAPGLVASDVRWDFDGDGVYETDSGTSLATTHQFLKPGTVSVGLRVTRPGGRVDATTMPATALLFPPAGPVGVSVDDAAQYTNDPRVTLDVVWKPGATAFVVSNDGGFKKAKTVDVSERVAWTLDSSGPERLPKTIYLRFAGIEGQLSDDIILDETPPTISSGTVSGGATATRAAAAAAHYTVHVKAADRTSGVSKLQATANKKKPGKLLKYKTKVMVSGKRPKYIRVQDRAGNFSRWTTLKQK
jgi:hypothetical protein